MALDLGAEIHFVECTAPMALIRQRLKKRRWEIFRTRKTDFDPTTEWIKKHGFRVRVDQAPETLARNVLTKI